MAEQMTPPLSPLPEPVNPSGYLLQSAGEVYYPERVDKQASGQAYLDQLKAYETSMRDKGYLVRQPSTPTLENAWMYAENKIPVEDMFNLGYEFRTNADKLAKTKKNPTAQVWLNPSSTYSLVNERGQDQVVASGSDIAALDNIYQTARGLSQSGGKKANWKLVETLPDGTTRVMADDDPKSKLGGILDIALPLLGAALVPLTGGISGALGAAVGGAGGSTLSGTLQGKSLGNILKNAAISGGLSYLGGSLLGPGTGGGGAITGGAGTGSLIGNAADDIIVEGVKRGAAGIAPGILGGAAAAGALGGAALGGAFGGGSGGFQDNPIVVEASKPLPVNIDPAALAAVGLTPASIAAIQGSGGGLTTDKVAKYLQIAALASGLAGDLFGGGGNGSGNGALPPGMGNLNPVFSATLPTNPTVSRGTARAMPDQDWTKYGTRPEQSFWTHVPQTYVPPVRMAKGGFAVKGRGTGRSDEIDAKLSDGEYVIDAETVALLGDGSNDAGAKALDDLRVAVRKHKGRSLAKGRFSVKAKKPERYLGRAK